MRVLVLVHVLVVLVLVVLVVTWENKVNSYSDQLKLGQVCKFGVEFDNILMSPCHLSPVTDDPR